MDQHRYAGFPNQPEVALCQILQEAQHRWLRPTEVCEILRNYRKFKLTPDPPHKPQSGSLFLFDRKALRYFRKDGHNWRKKRDGKTVREAHERLKAGSVEVLHCYYAHGEDNENFQRRSYWMLDTHEHIVLVHYREVKEGNRSGMRSPNSYSIDGANSRGIAGSSPQTSPLVSPRASSSNSVEWNGPTHSPENEEPESSDDTDQCRLQQMEPNRMLAKPAAVPVNNSRYLQTSTSFSAPKQNGSNYDKKPPLPAFYGENGPVVNQQQVLGMQTAQRLPSKQENGTRVPPGGFDLLEWGEVLKQGKLWEGKGNGLQSDGFVDLPDWTNTLQQYSTQQHQNRDNPLALPGVNSVYGDQDLKFKVQETHSLEAFGAQLHAYSQGLPDVGMQATGKPNSSAVQWNAVLGHTVDQGNIQSSVFGVFDSELLNESQQPQLHFTQGYMGAGQALPSQNDSFNKDMPSLQSYSHVFQDFQADTPLQLEEQDTFKKLDSFGRWINQEFGANAENSVLPVESDNDTIWASALDDHGAVDASLVQQMQLDVGSLPYLTHQQCFTISDFSPGTGISTGETKVLVTGSFTHAVEDPTASKWCCMFGDIEVPAELLQPGVLRCNAPPHSPSKVCFYITRNDRVPCSDIREFEYQLESKSFIKETSGEGFEGGALSKRDMLFQIRLARMLSPGAMPLESSSLDETSKWGNDLNPVSCYEEWEDLEEQLTESGCLSQTLKEQLIEKMLKEKLSLWLPKRAFGGGKGASVLDDNGLGVLHMGAALGYTWSISPILAAGVNINFRDSRGWTALHWAGHCGREAMVVALLAAGAAPGAKTDPTTKFPDGQTPADLASIERHKGIAGYLAESSLTSHLSLLTLQSNMDGNITSPLVGKSVVETVSERMVVQPNIGQSEEQVSLLDSLAAVRNAAQAAARIQSAFRAHSFRKQQEFTRLQEDEYGISNEEAQYIVAAQRTSKGTPMCEDESSRFAAVRIQQKFRGWKGRRDFLLFRQHVVKIQAHFRGHQVRKQYNKILWSVGIVEKAILRWRRKGKGLRGFCADGSTANGNDDFLKAGRKQIEVGLEKALARVQSMVRSPEAREQYRRLVEGYQKTKSHFEGDISPKSDNNDDMLYTQNFRML